MYHLKVSNDYDDNMQIGSEVTLDENVSIVCLPNLFFIGLLLRLFENLSTNRIAFTKSYKTKQTTDVFLSRDRFFFLLICIFSP